MVLHLLLLFYPLLGEPTARQRIGVRSHHYPKALTATFILERSKASPAPARETVTAKDNLLANTEQPGSTDTPQNSAVGVNLLPFAGALYFTTDQLTKRPIPLKIASLDPPQTRDIIASGKLILRLRINSSGRIVEALVEESNMPTIFAEAVTDAFLQSRFRPGEKNGLRVATLMWIEVRYDDKRLSLRPTFNQPVPLAGEN